MKVVLGKSLTLFSRRVWPKGMDGRDGELGFEEERGGARRKGVGSKGTA